MKVCGNFSKGISPLIAAVMLVAMAVVLSVMVSSWLTTYSAEASNIVRNTTQTQLQCQFANLRIKSANYNCSSSCMTGVPYRLNATVENSGRISIIVSRAITKLSNGQTYQFEIDDNSVIVGSSKLINFNGVLAESTPRIPVETMDRRSAYVNDGNTFFLCHFDSSPNCTASGNTTPNINTGTAYESGMFSSGIVVNTTDVLEYNATGNFNASRGTAEFFVKPSNASTSCSSCTFLYINTSTGDALKVFTSSNAFAAMREQNSSSVITSSVQYSAGTTYHVALAWGDGLRLYVNGVSESTSTDQGNMSGTPDKIRVGLGRVGNVSESVVDELRISKLQRFFSANLTYNVTFSSIERVRLYNLSNTLIDDSGSLGGVASYNKTVAGINITEHRIEVTKTDREIVTEFYPYTEGQSCFSTTSLTSITVSADNCPAAVDSIPGKDVTFLNCI